MRAYSVTSSAHEPKIILAQNPDHAAAIVVAWQVLNDIDPAEFAVSRYLGRDLTPSQKRELIIACSWGVAGIALLQPDGGWGIEAPLDERQL